MKPVLLLILLLNLCGLSHSQSKEYARSVVNKLASPEMKGRGYVQKGDSLSAGYIRSEFKKIGLKPFNIGYRQYFTTPVNTFPDKIRLTINNDPLPPGEAFLVEGGSPSISGTFETVLAEPSELLDPKALLESLKSKQGNFLVLKAYNRQYFSKEEQKQLGEVINFLKYHPKSPVAGILQLTTDKLTWAPSPIQYAKPTLIIKADSANSDIQEITVTIESIFIENYKSQNIIGYLEGVQDDSLIVLTAHYDHLGMMGAETIFPGANDNASGVAMLLNLAKYYTKNPPKFTTVFIAFGGEEIGLVGSKYFVENPLFDLDRIRFLLNFDLAGTGDEGIQVVNGSVYKEKFELLQSINEEKDLLEQVKIRGEACNSDHCMFYQKGVPSFFIYTLGGIQAYHDIYDKPETLPLSEFEDYFKLVTSFIEEL